MLTLASVKNSRRIPAASTILLSIILIAQAVWFSLTTGTWLDEGIYLYKSTAHVGYGLNLYSQELPCWYTPLYFIILGIWQETLGYGLLSGRTLSFLFYIGTLVFAALIARKLHPGRWTIPGLLFLVAITPSIAGVNCTVTQFAIVNIQSAMLLLIMFTSAETRSRWIVSGLLIGLISMTRPNMLLLLPLLPVLYFWVKGWQGWRPVLELTASFLVVIIGIIAIYGEGAVWNMIRAYPGSGLLADITGLNQHPAAASLTELGLKEGKWWTARPDHQIKWYIPFLSGHIWPYLLIIAINLVGILKWHREGMRPSIEAGFALLFFWSSTVHFIGIQSFCKSCAQGYMSYSILPGLLGAVLNMKHAATLFREIYFTRRWTAPALATVAVIWISSAWIPKGLAIGPYWKWLGPNKGKSVVELATKLDKILPADAQILTLGEDIRMVEAVHLAGRTVEPLTINYFFSLREPIDPEKEFTKEETNRYRTFGVWTLKLMNTWLTEEHDYVLYQQGKFPRPDLIEEWFSTLPLFPEAKDSEFYSTLRLGIRKKRLSKDSETTLAPSNVLIQSRDVQSSSKQLGLARHQSTEMLTAQSR